MKSTMPRRVSGSPPVMRYFCYAEPGSDADEAQRFLVRENLSARQPFLQFLRHAVGAAFVTTVGDRNAQIGDAMTKAIFHSAQRYGGTRVESRK